MRSVLLTIVFLVVAVLLLCVGILFRKDHSFRSQHISENERMKSDGIRCATSQDRKAQNNHKKIDVKNL